MSDRPDFTTNTALNAVADTLDSLPVSIDAQSIGSLAVDIAAQSAGDIDINLNSNSVGSLSTTIEGQTGDVAISFNSQTGNVDINFQDQAAGVESGKEFAASQANTVTNTTALFISSGGSTTRTILANNTGGPLVIEFFSGAQAGGFTEQLQVRFILRDAGGGSIAQFDANPSNLPLSLDPGIRIPDNGVVDAFITNNSSSSVLHQVSTVAREGL
jgi:hypothetical protein